MAVFRIEKTRDYTVMSNYHLRDRSLSLKAKGLLSLMLSLPEDWDEAEEVLEEDVVPDAEDEPLSPLPQELNMPAATAAHRVTVRIRLKRLRFFIWNASFDYVGSIGGDWSTDRRADDHH